MGGAANRMPAVLDSAPWLLAPTQRAGQAGSVSASQHLSTNAPVGITAREGVERQLEKVASVPITFTSSKSAKRVSGASNH
jgi:hypothetical protein